MNKVRKSNLELFRIICMIIIIFSHYGIHGFDLTNMEYGFNRYLVGNFCFGQIGVIGFVLISGYFMIDSKFTMKKLLKLIGQVLFYSWISLFIFGIILEPQIPLNFNNIARLILPIIFGGYWFATTFIFLMILSPFLNKFIKSISKEDLKKIIIILVVAWCLIGGLLKTEFCFSEFGYFILIYFIASYIKLYMNFDDKKLKINTKIMIISILLLVLSVIFFTFVGYHFNISYFYLHPRGLTSLNSIFTLIASISLFIYFLNLNIKTNKTINTISSCVFGVYLLHDNILVRPYLWNVIFKNYNYANSNFLFLHAIGSVILIYIVCTIIEYFRQKLIEPLYLKLINYLLEKYNKCSLIKKITKKCDKI